MNRIKIAIASDHGGFILKNNIIKKNDQYII